MVDRYWKVVDVERVAVRGSRHGGYHSQRYENVYSGITKETHSLRNLKGSCGRHLPSQRPKSVLQFESDRVFDPLNSEINVPERWLHAQQCLVVAACESTVAMR